jgi:hypothetical protein
MWHLRGALRLPYNVAAGWRSARMSYDASGGASGGAGVQRFALQAGAGVGTLLSTTMMAVHA